VNERMRVALRAAVAVALIAAPFVLNAFRIGLLTEVLIFGLFAASLDLLLGVTGMVSLGHSLFFGVGAYAAALAARSVSPQVTVTVLAGIAVATLVALVTGALIVRARGVYFLMLTLAFAQLAFSLAESWTPVTGGANGLPAPAPELLPGSALIGDRVGFYYYALVAFALGYAALRRTVDSPFGRSLAGVRENEARMRAVGYAVQGYKLAAYCTAGAFAGLAGALYAQQQRFVTPDLAGFETAALVLVMVILGGRGTLSGPVLGAAVVLLLRDELSARFEEWPLVLGALFIVVVYLLPRGVGGLFRRPAPA
jgi:branched-chain amino acid transport system permease protein